MNIVETMVNEVIATKNDALKITATAWLVLEQQAVNRTNFKHVALDVIEALDQCNEGAALDLLKNHLGTLWPECDEERFATFCPLCASVQSAMFVWGVAPEVERVLPHLLLLKNRSRKRALGVAARINDAWMNVDAPEAGFTAIYEGPGWLAFVEQV